MATSEQLGTPTSSAPTAQRRQSAKRAIRSDTYSRVSAKIHSTPEPIVVLVEGETDCKALDAVARTHDGKVTMIAVCGDTVRLRVLDHARHMTYAPKKVVGVVDRDWEIKDCCSAPPAKPMCRTPCAARRLTTRNLAFTDFTDLESDLIRLGHLQEVLFALGENLPDIDLQISRAEAVASELGFLRHRNHVDGLGLTFKDKGISSEHWRRHYPRVQRVLGEARSVSHDSLDLPTTHEAISSLLGCPGSISVTATEMNDWYETTGGLVYNGKDLIVVLVDLMERDNVLPNALVALTPPASGGPFTSVAKGVDRSRELHHQLIRLAKQHPPDGWTLQHDLNTFLETM